MRRSSRSSRPASLAARAGSARPSICGRAERMRLQQRAQLRPIAGSRRRCARTSASSRSSAASSTSVSAPRLRRAYSARKARPRALVRQRRAERLVVVSLGCVRTLPALADSFGKGHHVQSLAGQFINRRLDSATPLKAPECGLFPQFEIGFAPRLAALYAAFFVVAGIQLAVLPGLAEGQGARSRHHRPGAGGADAAAHPGHSAGHARSRPARRLARGHRAGERVERRRLRAGRPGRRARSRSCSLMRSASLAFTPVMPLSETYALQGPRRARPHLWAGAAVGLGHLRPRHFRRRLCADIIPARHIDLADGGGEHRRTRWRRSR